MKGVGVCGAEGLKWRGWGMGLRKRHMRHDNKKGAVSAHVNNVHVEYANSQPQAYIQGPWYI